jgi:hypothetical protein
MLRKQRRRLLKKARSREGADQGLLLLMAPDRYFINYIFQGDDWMTKNYYWISFSLNNVNQGCINVEADNEKVALEKVL